MLGRSKYSVLLRPLAYLYGLGVGLRNLAFACGLLPVRSYPIPIICVGNISVGGTGKTPHVEYVLSLLTPRYRVAVLSRGYKRRSKGLIVARPAHTAEDIGDEPRQILAKYPMITLVVDGNRRRAMDYLMSLDESERPEVVVMDDGLQHRYVRPSYRIMLVDYARLLSDDRLMPEGRLREPARARYRMNCVIVTKCPRELRATERRGIERNLALRPWQRLFFTRIEAERGKLRPLASLLPAGDSAPLPTMALSSEQSVFLLSGIAGPEAFAESLRAYCRIVGEQHYGDHHNYSLDELKDLEQRWQTLVATHPELIILTTEKDAMRLAALSEGLSPQFISRLYYLPIRVLVPERERELDRQILLAAKAKPQSLQD